MMGVLVAGGVWKRPKRMSEDSGGRAQGTFGGPRKGQNGSNTSAMSVPNLKYHSTKLRDTPHGHFGFNLVNRSRGGSDIVPVHHYIRTSN